MSASSLGCAKTHWRRFSSRARHVRLSSETDGKSGRGGPATWVDAIPKIFARYRAGGMCYIFGQAAKGVAETTRGNWQ